MSLKKFLKLPKSFKTEILDQVYPIDFLEWLQIENHNCRVKSDARALRQGDYNGMLKKYRVPRRKYLPREFRSLLSKFTAWCKVCCQPFYPEHLEDHGVKRIRIDDIEDLDVIERSLGTDLATGGVREPSRAEVVDAFTDHFRNILCEVDQVLQEYAEVFDN